ncbi:MAG: glycosyltransferase family 2 protein [Chitinophagales bacterium]
MKISTVIITKNEAKNIAKCLNSVVKISTEIILIDDFSEDQTIDIAKSFPRTRFYQRKFDDFINQKNYGISKVENEFILSLDADEYFDDRIGHFINNLDLTKHIVVSFPRINYIAGKKINYGIWKSDRKIRLWKKELGHWTGPLPHEQLDLTDCFPIWKSDIPIHHNAYESLDQLYIKAKKYGKQAAKRLVSKPFILLIFSLFCNPVFKFVKGYVFLQGFRDGFEGFHIAASSFIETYIKYFQAIQLKWKQ